MPDGRYAVGYPNLQYNYGQHALALFIPAQKPILCSTKTIMSQPLSKRFGRFWTVSMVTFAVDAAQHIHASSAWSDG